MEMDLRWKKKMIYSGVFILENRLHAIMDRYLGEVSSKQWLLLVITAALPEVPTLSVLAKHMGCSRQNVKKLAASLNNSGYIKLMPSESDARTLCVHLTDQGKGIIENSASMEAGVHKALFGDFTDEEIGEYFRLFRKMTMGMERLEEYLKTTRNAEEGF